MTDPIIAEGPHSITTFITSNVRHLEIVRSGDCENVIVFTDNKWLKITAFVNSANEPQIRIAEIQFDSTPKKKG
jgi:Tat protein secretion system quality control protein TatD with DNase activity